MAFQQQIDARVSFERLRHLRREGLLRVAIIDGIRFSFQAVEDTNQDVRAIGGNRRKGRDAGEQQDPIGSRVSAGLCLGNGLSGKFPKTGLFIPNLKTWSNLLQQQWVAGNRCWKTNNINSSHRNPPSARY